jgi:hypothetical protein
VRNTRPIRTHIERKEREIKPKTRAVWVEGGETAKAAITRFCDAHPDVDPARTDFLIVRWASPDTGMTPPQAEESWLPSQKASEVPRGGRAPEDRYTDRGRHRLVDSFNYNWHR